MEEKPATAINVVHDDDNWRQRIRTEEQSCADWRKYYGFLAEHGNQSEAIAKNNQVLNDAKRGAVNGFLKATYGEDTPLTSLDRDLALKMRPHRRQGLGIALQADGIDPIRKYDFPVSTTHEIGWQTFKYGSLEAGILAKGESAHSLSK